MASSILASVVRYQDWPTSVYLLLISTLGLLVAQMTWRPSFPKSAPELLKSDNWPLVGVLRFFSDRNDFIKDAITRTKTGNYSFYFGKHQIVGVSGVEGRKTFFESKELSLAEGYATLLTTTPTVEGATGEGDDSTSFGIWFSRTMIRLMKKENFVKNLPLLVKDTSAALSQIAERQGGTSGIFDPYDDIYRIVYQLTMRTVGANEIAESPDMLRKSLGLFEQIEEASSPARIIFPWLPTYNYFKRTLIGGKLYMIFDKIARDRKTSGRRDEDAMQFLLDSGDDMVKILAFVLGALFAGQLNSGINAAAMLCDLAVNPVWKQRVRDEVDGVLAKHRTSKEQTTMDIFSKLTVEEWETEFPQIDLCLRETIREQMVGTAFRKNVSGNDVVIGKSGEVVPKNAFAIYSVDDVHMNPQIYQDPDKWDPARYLPDRAEDKKQPHAYIGWGVARHPCLGMKFAKLEMGIIGAMFISMFDYSLADANGNPMTQPPIPDRNRYSAHKPKVTPRLKYTVRQ